MSSPGRNPQADPGAGSIRLMLVFAALGVVATLLLAVNGVSIADLLR